MSKVIKGNDFTSKIVATRDYKKDETIAELKEATEAKKSWSTVQVGKDKHVELNSDFINLNHSCAPTVKIDTTQMKVIATRDIRSGEEFTFFYPSTEWEMAQPFPCWCGAPKCLKTIKGAKDLTWKELDGFELAPHIKELYNALHPSD